MKKLRIHKMPYVNQGTANINLKGVKEYHAIFKFDTDEEAIDFIREVIKWHDGIEKVGDKIKKVLKDEVKKPVPEKRKAGRPAKADIQG